LVDLILQKFADQGLVDLARSMDDVLVVRVSPELRRGFLEDED
jgi:hypothetical protein